MGVQPLVTGLYLRRTQRQYTFMPSVGFEPTTRDLSCRRRTNFRPRNLHFEEGGGGWLYPLNFRNLEVMDVLFEWDLICCNNIHFGIYKRRQNTDGKALWFISKRRGSGGQWLHRVYSDVFGKSIHRSEHASACRSDSCCSVHVHSWNMFCSRFCKLLREIPQCGEHTGYRIPVRDAM